MLDINANGLISGKEIYQKIQSKNSNYSLWVKRVIEYADLKDNKDFFTKLLKSTGGRPETEYDFTVQAAKEICLLEKNEQGKKIRQWLISISDSHETGLSFTAPQFEALIDLSKAMTLISIQESVEKKHFDIYNNKYSWHDYRAKLLGYSAKDVINAMQKVNKKHKSIRKSLIKLDGCELIRVGVIDFMIALGKSKDYATNTGNLCKSIAEKMELGNVIWDDTESNPLKLNNHEVDKKKGLFRNFINKL